MNIGAPWPDLFEAELRVHGMQTKLHQWATSDPGRCFDDVFNLVCDPAFLVVAWACAVACQAFRDRRKLGLTRGEPDGKTVIESSG